LGKSEKAVRRIKAPMPGLVVKVLAQKNAFVKKGQPLVVVEAMKMENEIPAPVEGVVTEVKVQEKQTVDKDQILAIITE
jgi:biotin carboxyl carrier protein